MDLALLCDFLFLLLCVGDLSLLVRWLPQLVLLEVGVSEVLRHLHTPDVNLCGGDDHEFLVCSTQRNPVEV